MELEKAKGYTAEMIASLRSVDARPVLMTLPSVVSDDMTVAELRRHNVQFPYFPSAYGTGDLVDLIASYNRSIRRIAGWSQLTGRRA